MKGKQGKGCMVYLVFSILAFAGTKSGATARASVNAFFAPALSFWSSAKRPFRFRIETFNGYSLGTFFASSNTTFSVITSGLPNKMSILVAHSAYLFNWYCKKATWYKVLMLLLTI